MSGFGIRACMVVAFRIIVTSGRSSISGSTVSILMNVEAVLALLAHVYFSFNTNPGIDLARSYDC
jgi:hypothetical protein